MRVIVELEIDNCVGDDWTKSELREFLNQCGESVNVETTVQELYLDREASIIDRVELNNLEEASAELTALYDYEVYSWPQYSDAMNSIGKEHLAE